MALLVGTVIQSARASLPDASATLPIPGAAISPINVPGSTLFPGTYYAVVTSRNAWGETTGSEYGSFTVGHAGDLGNALQVNTLLNPGTTIWRVYLTGADTGPGTETTFVEAPNINPIAGQAIVISSPPTAAGLPPTRNSAYNPDTDGLALSAGQIYLWLNEALTRLSRIVGGVLDYSGVGTVVGQPYYIVNGQWLDIPNLWYDGFWIQGGDPGTFYKRNRVESSVLSNASVSIFDDRCVLEVSYQPARTAGQTVLAEDLDPSDTSASVVDSSQFFLPNGFAQIGTEIVAYSSTGVTPLAGLIRRLGGTWLGGVPGGATWPAGTPVQELNLFFQGRRILELDLQPGMSLVTLPIPAGWLSLLTDYIIAKFRSAELNYEEQQARLQEFDAACRDWAQNRTIEKHVQVGGNRGRLVFARTVAGGVIIP